MGYLYDFNQFFGVVGRASNIGHGVGSYTATMFEEDFPQFFKRSTEQSGEIILTPFVPLTVLDLFISQANEAVQPDKWGDGWRYAAGLYVAHYSTMYLRNYNADPQTAQEAAATGSVAGIVKSATLGDSSVSYDTSAVSAALADWGDFNATSYGQQFATRARIVGMGGMTVI